jgi:hypothetical protein
MTFVSRLQFPIAIALMAQLMFATMPIAVNAESQYLTQYLSILGRSPLKQTNHQANYQNGRRLELESNNYRSQVVQKLETQKIEPQKVETSNLTNTTNNRSRNLSDQEKQNTKIDEKVGSTRRLPSLQTRARPPLQPDTLHMGMVQAQFFDYAKDNNWLAIETKVGNGNEATFYQWLPGGEAVYALPGQELVYARGFIANVYFQDGRLVGMRLMPDRREQVINAKQLLTLARAWFPDDVLSILYQVAPSDPNQLIIDSLIGSVPGDLKDNFGNNNLPFCRVVVFPAPVPVNASLASCATSTPADAPENSNGRNKLS